jgi:DNA-binding CsgD family transcriptional regulator/PAS domain-containing protein
VITPEQISNEFDQLVASIYQGALDTVPWQGFIPQLGIHMNARAVSLVLRAPAMGDTGLILNYQRPDPGAVPRAELADPSDWQASAYREHFFALDPFVNLPIGEVATLSEIVPEQELLTSEFYLQYLKPAEVFHIIGADVQEPSGVMARLRISRSEHDPKFGDADKHLVKAIVPHLLRSIQIHARLNNVASERDLYANVVDRLAVGTIILDENGKILSCNAKATELLKQKDGISQHGQTLHVNNREQTLEFQQQLDKVLSHQNVSKPTVAEAMRVCRPSGRADLGLIIRPVPTSEWSEGQSCPSVAVLISDPEQQSNASLEIITRLFGFTPAEAALTMLIAKGKSLAEASETQGVSQHTARAQLKSIFSKTGVSRQAELVRLIVKSVADLG